MDNKIKTKKTFFYAFLITLLISALVIKINCDSTKFVWVNPNVNTKTLPYISTVIHKLDKGVKASIKNANANNKKMTLLYENAYGSGFLKNNPIPNDLDYAIGIHLGKYEFDGNNAKEIAESIEEKMSTFQAEFYNYISEKEANSMFSNYSTLSSIIMLSKHQQENINNISSSLDKINKDKEYIVYSTKVIDEQKNIKIKFPFVLKSNEILIENYSPIMLFTDDINYNQSQKKYLKEITIVIDFFVDIKDSKTKKTKTVELVSESFVGQRLQLSRRFFVPIVFVDKKSANYLSKLEILNNNDKYIEYRTFNFKRHLQEFANLKEMQDQPVKLLKRILQCKELIAPALDEKTISEINQEVSKNLNKKDLQTMNDYSNALGNLIQIVQLERLYASALQDGKMTEMLSVMNNCLDNLKNSENINANNLNKVLEFQQWVNTSIPKIKNSKDLIDFNEAILTKMDKINVYIKGIYKDLIPNQSKLLSYVDLFNNIYIKAGFHKADMYWINDNTLGIIKDKYTSQIDPKKLKQVALENALADVNYQFITEESAPKLAVRYGLWIRFNPTLEEEKYWNNIKQKLIDDKKNFNIKEKTIIKF